MAALLRRRPLLSLYVLAIAWTWTFVIVALLIVFATRRRLGYPAAEARSVAPAYSTP